MNRALQPFEVFTAVMKHLGNTANEKHNAGSLCSTLLPTCNYFVLPHRKTRSVLRVTALPMDAAYAHVQTHGLFYCRWPRFSIRKLIPEHGPTLRQWGGTGTCLYSPRSQAHISGKKIATTVRQVLFI